MPDRSDAEETRGEPAISFPDRNPNPVMRVTVDGELVYANDASEPIRTQLGTELGDRVPASFLDSLVEAANADQPKSFEVECGLRTFSILAVRASSTAMNVYGSDVTGAKVVEKFPDRNPNPVLRVSGDGSLLYANVASGPIVRALGLAVGAPLPRDLLRRIDALVDGEAREAIEVSGGGRIYTLAPVRIPEFGFTNLYGTDVTALRAINKFPDENPHPVLRMSRDGVLTYANPASEPVRRAFGVEVGESLPADLLRRVDEILAERPDDVIEVEHDGRTFEVRVVSLFEFESINFYGTDVTAARQVERANAENERLLLNILPPSIAARLRRGEEPIADAFDDLAVLFADVVDFTPYAAAHPAREVVGVLNEIFSILDRLVERHGLEKIKTVGDAYMVVGGITRDGGGTREIAEMSLDLLEELGRYRTAGGMEMQVRVGLHVGPGIGGVIGLKKFIYDVWGDTVNTASRMESHGVPGCIQVTADTARRLEEHYVFERRGIVDVKGKGPTETWFLLGRR